MDNFRWYDWVAIILTADMLTATVLVIISGVWSAVFSIPLIMGIWFIYEEFRRGPVDDERSD